jgi:2-polyprenyl-3-methyl-5-hydroxy-6-metoxy-1,4-benzoquinol methylase
VKSIERPADAGEPPSVDSCPYKRSCMRIASKVRTIVAVLIATAGLAIIGLVPSSRRTLSRDLERARTSKQLAWTWIRPLPRSRTRIDRRVTNQIRFDDGAAYERYMRKWSQYVGAAFLDWLAPASGLGWLDVGCGNGAFSEMLTDRCCAPRAVDGIDPSEAQLTFARTRPALRAAQCRAGDAMAVPFEDDTFDAAVMPLVIFFVPDPA